MAHPDIIAAKFKAEVKCSQGQYPIRRGNDQVGTHLVVAIVTWVVRRGDNSRVVPERATTACETH